MLYRTLLLLLFVAIATNTSAQQLTSVPFDSDRWEIFGDEAEMVTYKGKSSFFAKQSGAILKDANFKNGTITFNIAVPEQRAFPGVYFRMENDNNYEEFYIRPHQSGNPDAAQYTPVYNGITGWQLYHGPGFSGQMSYEFDVWMPAKIVIRGDEADIFVNDLEKPLIHVNDLKRDPISGALGLRGTPEGVYFSDFKYSTDAPAPLVGSSEEEKQADANTITQWAVSAAFNEADLAKKTMLGKAHRQDQKWKPYKTEPSGLLNLAQTAVRSDETNTVFAKVNINSDSEQIQKLTIGFSDRAKIYLNGQILFGGQDGFRSRDYRYLGTIGYFDDVYLPLKAGDNELIIAVSENFGGWGLQAKFESTTGISWSAR